MDMSSTNHRKLGRSTKEQSKQKKSGDATSCKEQMRGLVQNGVEQEKWKGEKQS